MKDHLLGPMTEPDNLKGLNMGYETYTSSSMESITNLRHRTRSSYSSFKIKILHPKRKTRSFVMRLIGRKYFAKNYASKVIPLFVILSFIQLLGHIKYANATTSEESKYGLTAYAEPCTDECKQRGFPYTWCHKKPSRNGTWIDRDYCSPGPGLTRYLEPCLESCHQDRRERSGDFYWCKTAPTPRGDWDYCSPYPR